MATVPDLDFRPLGGGEGELARELFLSLANKTIPEDGESFGLNQDWRHLSAAEGWGLFIRGSLSGVAWLRRQKGGAAEVLALALPPGWWKMGLSSWMLEELSNAARKDGLVETLVHLHEGGRILGEIMIDAGFAGPDSEEEGFPKGEWRRRNTMVESMRS